jgi:hypothetical protein
MISNSGEGAAADQSRYRLRRGQRGARRIERSASWYGGWIARGVDGYRLPWGDGFEWRTRECAWTVCLEDDLLGGPERRAEKAKTPGSQQ